MAKETVFADGLHIKWLGPKDSKRPENTPAFVLGKISFKMADFIAMAKANHKDGWLNVDIKISKGGKKYAEVDTWEPTAKGDGEWGGDTPTAKPPVTDDRDWSQGDPDTSGFPTDAGDKDSIPF